MAILNTYLIFRDDARQAMEFYQHVFGGELEIHPFSKFPDMVQDPDAQNLVMHASLTTPDGLTLMACDAPEGMSIAYGKPAGFSVSLGGITPSAAQETWDKLSVGATITMPLDDAPWGGTFGTLTDKFGTPWMLSGDVQ